MVLQFTTTVDFELNQSKNFVLEQLTSLPDVGSLVVGRVFVLTNTSTGESIPYYYNGTQLIPFGGTSATSSSSGLMSAEDKALLEKLKGYSKRFGQSDLTSSGLLIINHGLDYFPGSILVWDASGRVVYPNPIDLLSPNIISLDFSALQPLEGSFTISVIPCPAVPLAGGDYQFYTDGILLREGGVEPSVPAILYRSLSGYVLTSVIGNSLVYVSVSRNIDGRVLKSATGGVVSSLSATRSNGGMIQRILAADSAFSLASAPSRFLDGSRLKGVIADTLYTSIQVRHLSREALKGVSSDSTYSCANIRFSEGQACKGVIGDSSFTISSGINPALYYGFI